MVIFLESEGALTEFGLFFGNQRLRDKLVIVLHEEFHRSESFIKFGLLNPLEDQNQNSVRVYTIDHRNIENVSNEEVKDILDDILDHSKGKEKSEIFDPKNRGHKIFIVYQLVDLFISLTKYEIINYLERLDVESTNNEITSALYILQKFNLIDKQKKSSQYFFFTPNELSNRIKFHFAKRERRFDSTSIKIEVNEFYKTAAKSDPSHKRRMKVIHPSLTGRL